MDLINTPIHPVLAHWPLDDGTVEQLTASIDTLGFDPDHPITLATVDGNAYLMDGRARLAALERLGVAPIEGEHVVTQAFDSHAEVANAIVQRNGARRQLEKSQRAMLAAELLASDALPPAILEDLPNGNERGRSSKTSVTEALGRWLRVSGRLIRDAMQLLAFDTEHPVHRLVEKVRKGAMAIGGAMAHMRRALGERRDHYRRNLRFQPEDAKIIDAYAELLEERGSSLSAAMVEQARRELEAAGRLGGGRLNSHALHAAKVFQSEESRRAPLQVPLLAPCATTPVVERASVACQNTIQPPLQVPRLAPCADIPTPNSANTAREDAVQTPLQVPRLAPCAEVLAPEAGTYGLQPGAPAGTLASRQTPEITNGRQAPRAQARASSIHSPIHSLNDRNLGGEIEQPGKKSTGLDSETLTTLVNLYNQAVDAWSTAHPGEDKVLRHTRRRPGKGMRERLERAWAERPDLDSWREAFDHLTEIAPGALRAARINSLHRLLEPTMREPGKGIILWRLIEWLDWDPTKRDRQRMRPTPPPAPPRTTTDAVPQAGAPTRPRVTPPKSSQQTKPHVSTEVIAPNLKTTPPQPMPDPNTLTPDDLEHLDDHIIGTLSKRLANEHGDREIVDADEGIAAAFTAWRQGFEAAGHGRAPTLDTCTRMALWGALRRAATTEDLEMALYFAGRRGVLAADAIKTRLHLHVLILTAQRSERGRQI